MGLLQADRAARGPSQRFTDTHRHRGLRVWMRQLDQVSQDIRFAARMIVRERALSAVVIAILALAVAANTAIYSVVDTVMFRPLPYEDPDNLVVVSRVIATAPAAGTVALVHFDEWRRSATSFESLALLSSP